MNEHYHFYYIKDHLGNICAVWDATHDSVGATSGDKTVEGTAIFRTSKSNLRGSLFISAPLTFRL